MIVLVWAHVWCRAAKAPCHLGRSDDPPLAQVCSAAVDLLYCTLSASLDAVGGATDITAALLFLAAPRQTNVFGCRCSGCGLSHPVTTSRESRPERSGATPSGAKGANHMVRRHIFQANWIDSRFGLVEKAGTPSPIDLRRRPSQVASKMMKSPTKAADAKQIKTTAPQSNSNTAKDVPASQYILTTLDLVHPDNWVDKASRAKCYVCSRQFQTLLRPKHNCRKCGEVVCTKCRVAQVLHMPSVPSKEYSPILICLVCNHGLSSEPLEDKISNARTDTSPAMTPDVMTGAATHSPSSSSDDHGSSNPILACPYELDWNWVHPWPKPPALPSVVEAMQMEMLDSLAILDTPREDAFDRIAMAARKFTSTSCKVACVGFMDLHKQRQWFKGSCGLAQSEMPRIVSFCTHTIYLNQPIVVLDARHDERFCLNPLVTGTGQFRFYAGVPITVEGVCVGSIFVLDALARTEHEVDISKLVKLSHVVTKMLVERLPKSTTGVRQRKASFDLVGAAARPVSSVSPSPLHDGDKLPPHGRSYSMDMVDQFPPTTTTTAPPMPPPQLQRRLSMEEPLPLAKSVSVREPQPEPQHEMVKSASVPPGVESTENAVATTVTTSGGNSMETMLMNLLSQTTLTQQQIASQQGNMYQKLSEHNSQLSMLAEAVARMEAKLKEKAEKAEDDKTAAA
ncbi:Aste57867_24264 [Aphanomyces stellatus]|uniref:Aste57867_24264 protein n=1 Tax=Aphanomyces stellatus TaxID=120398 RepID=A0A485LPX8_9STRA|nr:hypothetical protein As57867_024189 [Aphanomyces stellatus]VFU00904.1 Aste57867_24264 [Aphanomyces stellatus]